MRQSGMKLRPPRSRIPGLLVRLWLSLETAGERLLNDRSPTALALQWVGIALAVLYLAMRTGGLYLVCLVVVSVMTALAVALVGVVWWLVGEILKLEEEMEEEGR